MKEMDEGTESITQTITKSIKQERSEKNNNKNKVDICPSPQPRRRNELPSFSKAGKFED